MASFFRVLRSPGPAFPLLGLLAAFYRVFFPKTAAWNNLQKSLKGRFNDSVWEHLAGVQSEPFILGGNQCIAVKVIDERGNELMVVRKAT